MKNKIILCEGKNDRIFVETLLESEGFSEKNYCSYNENKIKNKTEQKILNSYKDYFKPNGYRFLIKEEGGKYKLMNILKEISLPLINYILNEDTICIVIFDRNGVDFHKFIKDKKIFEKIENIFGKDKIKIKEFFEADSINIYLLLIQTTSQTKSIYFIEFNPSFEEIVENITGEDLHNCTDDEKRQRIIMKFINNYRYIDEIAKIIFM